MIDKKLIYNFANKWVKKFEDQNINYLEIVDGTMGDECRTLGFEMDCGRAFSNLYGEAVNDYEKLSVIIDEVLSRDDEQQGESGSISTQRQMLTQYCHEQGLHIYDEYVDATDIIGLKQNPTNGRRFSPIFSFIGRFSIQFDKMLLLKQRRKTEYGKDKAFVDLSKSMNAFRHFREQEALWQTQLKRYRWRNYILFRITHSA